MSSDNVNRLKAHYLYVYTHKMKDIPILNKKLDVETIGFLEWGKSESNSEVEVGVLITPWFMNLVLLPKKEMRQDTRVGQSVNILFPDGEYSFLTQIDDDFGVYLTCSLFSPMSDFQTQAQAIETAEAIMAQLLQTKEFKQQQKDADKKQEEKKNQQVLNQVTSRRRFLRGGK